MSHLADSSMGLLALSVGLLDPSVGSFDQYLRGVR